MGVGEGSGGFSFFSLRFFPSSSFVFFSKNKKRALKEFSHWPFLFHSPRCAVSLLALESHCFVCALVQHETRAEEREREKEKGVFSFFCK